MAEAAFTLSAGGGWSGMKMDLSTTTKVEASYRTSTKVDEEIVEKAKFGDVVIEERARHGHQCPGRTGV